MPRKAGLLRVERAAYILGPIRRPERASNTTPSCDRLFAKQSGGRIRPHEFMNEAAYLPIAIGNASYQ
jgi:hypothetical protein